MKTAMQELIEKLDYSIENSKDDFKIHFSWIKFHAELLLEKEKEQIIDAYRIASINNSPSDDIQNIRPEYWQVNAEMWYDKHYNQNK